MDARLLKTRYCIEHSDLPSQQATIVQIVGIDKEYFEGDDGIQKERSIIFFHGWRLPLRINNTRLDTLIAILGGETDLWIGKKIMLAAMPVSKFGRTEMDVVIHPMPAPDEAPHTPPPLHMLPTQQRGRVGPRLGQVGAQSYGSPHGHMHTPAIAAPTAAAALPGGAATTGPIGVERAVEIGVCLKARNKTTEELTAFLRKSLPFAALAGLLPVWSASLLPTIKQYLVCFPRVREVTPIDQEQLRQLFTPPAPPPQAAPSPPTESIDMATGEVISHGSLPTPESVKVVNDDIPF